MGGSNDFPESVGEASRNSHGKRLTNNLTLCSAILSLIKNFGRFLQMNQNSLTDLVFECTKRQDG